MAYKTIVVHLCGQSRDRETLMVACRISQQFGAYRVAVFSAQQPLLAAAAMDPSAAVAIEYQIEAMRNLEKTARLQVQAAESEHGISIEWRSGGNDVVGSVALHGRHADLLVLGQEDPDQTLGVAPSVPASVIMRVGRPVLVVPYAGSFDHGGNSVMVAWNGGRESARALADALPLLKKAAKVNIVSFNAGGNSKWGEVPGADIGLWLARHDVRVTVRQSQSPDVDVGNQILSLAADLGSDLIVMGAYGHSRAYEMILGGVTRTVLATMTVPVLMSH